MTLDQTAYSDPLCRVDLVDTGNDDRLVSISTIRTRVVA